MIQTYSGIHNAKGVKLAIILPRFHESVGLRLLEGSKQAFVQQGGRLSSLTVVRVPGSFEIPLTAQKLIDTKRYDAIIALGVLLKGETYHFEYVARVLLDGIRQVMLQNKFPVIFEVLIADSLELVKKRAGKTAKNNKGFSAVLSALEMINLFRSI
ncbi:6,7-dimethyl-8-ribityllumazine synthase [Candidatus Peregrinibacteria bacterium]|nr:6,7-dimethyl-8-ribityllumazine synthase [Candidatus Peregrinibacteria bacterium]